MLATMTTVPPFWTKDVPACAWERLFDWGFTPEESRIGHVIVACERILYLIETKDDYYFLEFGNQPLVLKAMVSDVQEFLDKYIQYRGEGID